MRPVHSDKIPVEPRVGPTGGCQFRMDSALDDPAVIDNQHLVRIANGGQAVGYDERDAVCHEIRQGLLADTGNPKAT